MPTPNHDDPHERAPGAETGHLRYPLRIAGVYALAAVAWSLFPGLWAASGLPAHAAPHFAGVAADVVYLGATTWLIYALAGRHARTVRQRIEDGSTATTHGAETQRLIAELLDNSPDAIFAKDRDGRYTLANREVLRVTGKAAADIIGQRDTAIFPAEQAELIAGNDRMVMQQDAVLRTVERLSTADGEIVYLVTKGPLHDASGRVAGMFGISRDVTEREAAKEKVAQALEALRESQVIAGIGSYVLDVARGVWESSDGLDRLLGIDSDQTHTIAEWIALVAAEDRDAMHAYLVRDVLGQGRMFDREYRIVRPRDGALRWVHGRGRLDLDSAGNPLRMRGTIQDITERVEAQAKAQLWLDAFERSGLCFAISDARTNLLVDVNPAFAARRGYTVEEMRGMPVAMLFAPGFTPAYHDPEVGVDRKAQMVFESQHACKDGSTFPVLVDLTVTSDASGHANMRVACAFDITERRKAEEDLRIAAAAFEAQDAVMVTDARQVIQRVNRAFTRITGYEENEVIGKTPAMLSSGLQDAKFFAQMWEAIDRDGYWQGELVNRARNARLFTGRLTISAVKDLHGQVTHYVGFFADVTEQRAAESKAEHLAYFDALTDLPNRTLLHDRMEHALAWSSRTRNYCALLFVDLDNFKKVNDTIGHHAGDQLLINAAQRLRRAVRDGDTVARFAGDEFVVMLEDLGDDAEAAGVRAGRIAESLRTRMAEAYDLDQQSFYCTASIGATLFKGDSDSTESILMHADLAMYRAKQDGRNALRFFEHGMQVELARRTTLESELRAAVDRRQWVLHFQPQFDRHGRLSGAEALVRWNHPTRGLLLPGEFIGLAEDTGIIVALGQWVLDAACAQLSTWERSSATHGLVLAVNVSARQFAQDDFVERVLASLAVAGAAATRLKIELTESTVLDNVGDALAKMQALKSAGLTFSLDDFGTGSSSLSYLTRLPLDQLKIDKSFVDELPQDEQDAMVAQTIIAMGKGLGLDVVAEGVETHDQWAFLLQHGCDVFQGFRFGAPLPIDDFDRLAAAQDAAAS